MLLREWLLKEEKAKVGRPKLANEAEIKKSYILIASSLLICVVMLLTFVSILKDMTPFEYINSIVGIKLDGIVENKDGFIVSSRYNQKGNYILKIKASDTVKSYSGSYNYTTYYLKNNNWVEFETKQIPKDKDSFEIEFESLKNENRTWKIKLQIINSSGTNKSYAPSSWQFVDANKMEDKYAYKVFTVKGYYSPVPLDESKETMKSKDKINISTSKNDPRTLVLDAFDYTYDVCVTYTDTSGKKTNISNKKGITGKSNYTIPNFKQSVKVTVKVWINSLSKKELESKKLSTWTLEEDKNKKSYITVTYILKPEESYRN